MNERPRDSQGQDPEDPERKPGVPPHQPPPARRERDGQDESNEESFPSSDPPATGGPGV